MYFSALSPSSFTFTPSTGRSNVQCKRPGMFMCGPYDCVSITQRCDGMYDCWNGADEDGCPQITTPTLTQLGID